MQATVIDGVCVREREGVEEGGRMSTFDRH